MAELMGRGTRERREANVRPNASASGAADHPVRTNNGRSGGGPWPAGKNRSIRMTPRSRVGNCRLRMGTRSDKGQSVLVKLADSPSRSSARFGPDGKLASSGSIEMSGEVAEGQTTQ